MQRPRAVYGPSIVVLAPHTPCTTAESDPADLPKWLRELKRLPPLASFGYGVRSCALPGAQYVYFLGGCAVISTSGLPSFEQFGLLLVFVAGLEVMLVTRIIICARRRDAAEKTFQRIDSWLGQHATTVFGVILAAVAPCSL